MTPTERRPGEDRGGIDDLLAGGVGTEDSHRVIPLPVRSLTQALDHLDERGLCACWTAPYRRRCKARRWSA